MGWRWRGAAKADADTTAAKAVAAMVAAHGMAGPPPARAGHEEDLLRRRLETMRLASLVTEDNTCDHLCTEAAAAATAAAAAAAAWRTLRRSIGLAGLGRVCARGGLGEGRYTAAASGGHGDG